LFRKEFIMEDIALFALRLVVGLLFIGHGSQKLFGWFGGYGIKGTGGWLESIGVKPGAFFATVAGLSELVGGMLLVLGFALPVAALLLGSAMLVAIVKVTGANGLWITGNGYEYNLVLLVLVVALAFTGAGRIAIGA
jgi:putative oxidoreductase